MKRQRSKNGRCLLCNITKTDQIHDTDRDLCDDNMYKKRRKLFCRKKLKDKDLNKDVQKQDIKNTTQD